MAPKAAAVAMRAWAEETNRLNRERRGSGEAGRQELAAMIDVIEDDGYVRGMVDRLQKVEARQDELEARLAAAPAAVPDIQPNVADVYQRKVGRLAVALDNPGERNEAATVIRELIERIVLTPDIAWGETDAKRR